MFNNFALIASTQETMLNGFDPILQKKTPSYPKALPSCFHFVRLCERDCYRDWFHVFNPHRCRFVFVGGLEESPH